MVCAHTCVHSCTHAHAHVHVCTHAWGSGSLISRRGEKPVERCEQWSQLLPPQLGQLSQSPCPDSCPWGGGPLMVSLSL